MKNRKSFAVIALSALLAAGCATVPDQESQAKSAKATQRNASLLDNREQVSATAVVESVDPDQRQIVLRGKRGKLHTMAVGSEVRNLSQLRPGDRVELTYYEALALSIDKDVPRNLDQKKLDLRAGRAEIGQRPARTMHQGNETVADVTAINSALRRVTLRGAERTVTVRAPKEVDISQLKVGDQVRVDYAEAEAIAIEPVMAKKKSRRR